MFKVGDEVFNTVYGKGVVLHTAYNHAYPICVKFENNKTGTYTLRGRAFHGEITPSHDIKLYKEKEMNQMPELKTGMRLVHHNGYKSLVVKDINRVIYHFKGGVTGFDILSYYDKDGCIDSDYRIIKVYGGDTGSQFLNLDVLGELLWELKEVSPEQQKIKELEETIKQASKQIEELKKVVQ